MSYDINFTESTNPAKTPLTIQDNSVNGDTNLKFPGRNVQGYGRYIGEDFLHLLENFAAPTPPNTMVGGMPIQGQLWFDTTEGVSQLKVYDGTQWSASGGLKKGTTEPAIANIGDLWVNTNTNQLSLYSGSGWDLVGPNFSTGQKTGAEAEQFIDIENITQTVITQYINNVRVAIISIATFVPKTTISGFTTIKAGVNLHNSYNTYWGTAEKAKALLIGSNAVSASNFLRGDVTSTTGYQFNIKNDLGLNIGNNSQIGLFANGADVVLYNRTNNGNITFRLTNNNVLQNVVTIDSRQRLGINNNNPQTALDVVGGILSTGIIKTTNTTESTNAITGSGIFAGGLGVTKNLNVGGNIATGGSLTVSASILPYQNNTINIGATGNTFNTIYANTFNGNLVGNFTGNVVGNVSGSASKLASQTTFGFNPDGDILANAISFDGSTGGLSKVFTATLNDTVITNKDPIVTLENTDEFLVSSGSILKKITKENIFAQIPQTPIGAIMPYAGATAPTGWLLCDGGEVTQNDFSDLFSVIGYNFGAQITLRGRNTFKLPDLRARYPMGLDDMNNNRTVPDNANPSINIPALETSPAGRVLEAGSTGLPGGAGGTEKKTLTVSNIPDHKHNMKGNAGTQFYGIKNTSTTIVDSDAVYDTSNGPDLPNNAQYLPHSGAMTGATNPTTPFNIMAPWLGINYIIYTGVI